MSKFWIRFWWGVVILGTVFMLVFWFIPEPVSENDAPLAERQAVMEEVKNAQPEFPDIRITQVKAHYTRVVEVNATWIGANPPKLDDRSGWEKKADEVAIVIAQKYIPDGWQANVAVWYRRLPRGIAGRAAGDNPEGGPARLFGKKDKPAKQ